jgi:DNA-binding transcriptional regulator YiaG
MDFSLAAVINRAPKELWSTLLKEHGTFIKDFEKRRRKAMDDFCASDPFALHKEHEAIARKVIAERLNLDFGKLSRISMLSKRGATPRSSGGESRHPHPTNTLTGDTYMRKSAGDENRVSHMQTEKHFPTRLAKALNKAGLTVAAAAEKWGINRRTIEGWKQGRSKPRGINLRFVEEALASIEGEA